MSEHVYNLCFKPLYPDHKTSQSECWASVYKVGLNAKCRHTFMVKKLQIKSIASEHRDNCQLRQENEIQIFDGAKYKQGIKIDTWTKRQTRSLADTSQLFPFCHSDFVNRQKQPNYSYRHLNLQMFITPLCTRYSYFYQNTRLYGWTCLQCICPLLHIHIFNHIHPVSNNTSNKCDASYFGWNIWTF